MRLPGLFICTACGNTTMTNNVDYNPIAVFNPPLNGTFLVVDCTLHLGAEGSLVRTSPFICGELEDQAGLDLPHVGNHLTYDQSLLASVVYEPGFIVRVGSYQETAVELKKCKDIAVSAISYNFEFRDVDGIRVLYCNF